MPYLELFDRVADHVRRLGVDVEFERGKPLSRDASARAKARSPVPIPSSLLELHGEVGDGFIFRWPPFDADGEGEDEDEDEQDARVYGMVAVPPLLKLAEDADRGSWRPARVRQWFAFHDEGNGDRFCLDTVVDPAPVVFDQHDARDANGHVLGPSLLDFFTGWASVCFQCPSGLWWPGVFDASSGGVDWRSREFREPFRMPDGR